MSPDRDIVATGGGDSGVRLWDLKDLEHNRIGTIYDDIFDIISIK